MKQEISNLKSQAPNESCLVLGVCNLEFPAKRGFTLIELMVSIGLFSVIVLLTSGAYFMMISINRQAQGIATGINNLSFALETMTREIRTGTGYSSSSGNSFTFTPSSSATSVTYALGTQQGLNGTVGDIMKDTAVLTDPSVDVTSLMFYPSGVSSYSSTGDTQQPHVTIIISGTVKYGPKATQTKAFTVETGATMRGTDL